MVWCWWCCHEVPGEPLKLPYKYDPMRDRFETMGQFCSWGCMKSFNLDKNGVNNGGIIGGNIVVMRKKLYNVVGPIVCAPSRFRLQEFGGDMSIEEFRKFTTVDTGPRVDLVRPIQMCNAEPRKISVAQMVTVGKMSEITNAVGTNEPLRLKRTKPLKREQNNLEKTLGLVRKKTT
jgi:hypothetical protein